MPAPKPTEPSVIVVSIGTLAANRLWDERVPVRTGHATTTLILAGERRILVDPGLPGPILAARLSERINLTHADITDVVLTSFKPDMRRGIDAFSSASWWISEGEREGVGVPLIAELNRAGEAGDNELAGMLRRDIAILQRCKPMPDTLAPGVDCFPMPGVTPGSIGVLVLQKGATILIAGDGVATGEHARRGEVLPTCVDIEAAQSSFSEALEIADQIIPGRDSLFVVPDRRPL